MSVCFRTTPKRKRSFSFVFAAPDDPSMIEEAAALSLVILRPGTAHSGKGTATSDATDAVTEALMRCRASGSQLFRNTLLFIAPDDANLGNAREVTAKAMAWASIVSDTRLQRQMTQAQATDAKEKQTLYGDGALLGGNERHGAIFSTRSRAKRRVNLSILSTA